MTREMLRNNDNVSVCACVGTTATFNTWQGAAWCDPPHPSTPAKPEIVSSQMATTQPIPPTMPTADDSTALSHIHVLHPTHTKAPLTLAVPSGARVADLKTAISERFPGQPKPNGQRIIWKGRIVVDEEVVGDIWKVGLLFAFVRM